MSTLTEEDTFENIDTTRPETIGVTIAKNKMKEIMMRERKEQREN